MDIRQLKLNYEYLRNEKRLEEEIHMVDRELSHIQNNCKHIVITLGHSGDNDCIGSMYERCIICGETEPNKVTSYPNFIDATFYKKEKYNHGESKEDREKKFCDLQELWMDYMKELPNESIEDKIKKLIKEIQENK